MARINPLQIPEVSSIDDLRRILVTQVNALAGHINTKTTKPGAAVDLGQNQIHNVADPSAGSDAVNLKTLQRELDKLEARLQPATNPKTVGPSVVGAGAIILNLSGNRPSPTPLDAGTFFFATDLKELYVVSGGSWVQVGQETDATFTPSGDGAASLGSTALRFLNLLLKGQIATGLTTLTTTPAILADLRNASTNGALLHLENSNDLDGMYLLSDNNKESVWSKGAYFDGTNWIATSDTTILVQLTKLGGGVRIFYNSSQTPNTPISPGLTLIFKIDSTGSITTANNINANGVFQAAGVNGVTGTCTIPAVTSNGTIVFNKGIVTSFTSPVGN